VVQEPGLGDLRLAGDLRDGSPRVAEPGEEAQRLPQDPLAGEIIDIVPASIAVVPDNGSCFRGETYRAAFAGDDPLLRHVRTRVRSPQTNGVIERFFGTLKYEHLYWALIDDGGAQAMKTARFRDIYNCFRPHQSLGDRTPRQAYLGNT
jgi:putative transposase